MILLLQIMVAILWIFWLAGLIALLAGRFYLRGLARLAPPNETAVLLKSPLVPPVSMIAVAADASAESRALVRRLLDLHFGRPEIVVVLNGLAEAEISTWISEFHLSPSGRDAVAHQGPALRSGTIRGIYESRDPIRLVVVDQQRASEAEARNAGVNVASSPVIGLADPGADFDPTLLLRLIRPMLEEPERTIAACCLTPMKPGAGWPERFGALESLRTWTGRFAAEASWKILLPVPGSAMVIQRDWVLAAGGFHAGPMDLVLRIHGLTRGKGMRVAMVQDARSEMPAPRSWDGLHAIAMGEQQELARTARSCGVSPSKWLAAGWRGLPALVSIRLVRPALETLAYPLALAAWLMGAAPLSMVGLVLLSTAGAGMLHSMAAVLFWGITQERSTDPEDLKRFFLAAIPENLGYRQRRNLWLIGGFFGVGKPRRARPAGRPQPAALKRANAG